MREKIDKVLEKACRNYEFLEKNSAFPDDLTRDEQDDIDCLIQAMCQSEIIRRCLCLVLKTANSDRQVTKKSVEAYGVLVAAFEHERLLLHASKKPRVIGREESLMPRIPRLAAA